jgi:hypothetical protein
MIAWEKIFNIEKKTPREGALSWKEPILVVHL